MGFLKHFTGTKPINYIFSLLLSYTENDIHMSGYRSSYTNNKTYEISIVRLFLVMLRDSDG